MLPKVIVTIELRRSHILICGTPLKYTWSDRLDFLRAYGLLKAPAVIDPQDLSILYVLEENRRFAVESMAKPAAEMFEFTMQESFWGEISLKLFRKSRFSRKFNEEQAWINANIAPSPWVSLLKEDQIETYVAKKLFLH